MPVALIQCAALAAAQPTYDDLRYSDAYPRCTMDLWLPKSDSPTPLIVVFHGGGFKGGSKDRNMPFRQQLMSLLDQGIAVASVGYPLLKDVPNGQTANPFTRARPYFACMREAANSIRFLQEHATKYNLDPQRYVCVGSSAGAVIAEYITYRERLGISFCLAIQQPYAVEIVTPHIKQGDTPLMLFTKSGANDLIHNPNFAIAMKNHCDQVGVTCWLYGQSNNALPNIPGGQDNVIPHAMEIIRGIWAGEVE
ncbi:alpha/beta hydrolase fold domain-containing protein [Cerasicoccus maritimus]|uniref:alpha/beta hydrolase fold domain-containing protein n=1 Tax=Cerasicoccus maritimus TaxID=490089 RepID=UPI0028525108|nr:alpha/beta hydrolase fold domain-containing protein [Cerasicoccus maritimus]